MGEGTILHETFVAYKMMRNNTLNKVHVAATELLQLLQNTKMVGEANPTKSLSDLCRFAAKRKKK